MLSLNGLIRDFTYGFRMMRNARFVPVAVTLTLAVGIGINTGIFKDEYHTERSHIPERQSYA